MVNLSTKHTVLIVDDQESVRRTLSNMLSMEGYEILLADDGERALELLKEKKRKESKRNTIRNNNTKS